jgi:hypothetical protein
MARAASRVRSVVVAGPLASFADAYGAELRARGYTPLTIVNVLRQVARLGRWLDAGGLTAADLSGERVEQFLAVQRAGGHGATGPGLARLLDVLRSLGVVEAERRVGRRVPAGDARYQVSGRAARGVGGPREHDWP